MSPINLPTVLIVDDERINRTALAELLKDECRVVTLPRFHVHQVMQPTGCAPL